MSEANATDLYVAVRTRDQITFNALMNKEFSNVSSEDIVQRFTDIREQIPQRWDALFRSLLIHWMAQDHISKEICQTCIKTLGFATLQHGDCPEVYKKIGIDYLLENHPMFDHTQTANSLINTTILSEQPKCFSHLSEHSKFVQQLDFGSNFAADKIFDIVTSLNKNEIYYTAFWNNLSSTNKWESTYLRNAIINNNLTAILDFLNHTGHNDSAFKEALLNGHRDYQVLHTMLPHLPNSWQTMALTYLLSVHLVSKENFDPIANLTPHEQIQIFDGVVDYWTQYREYNYLLNNIERYNHIFDNVVSKMPAQLDGWAVGEKNPLWREKIFPIVPAFERYVLQKHIGDDVPNMKKSKI